MLSMPREFDRKARGVGMQTWKVWLKRRRESLEGVQWAGSDGEKGEVRLSSMSS